MADKCTDITTIEELSIFYRWVEDGQPVEHFLEIVPLKANNAKTIYSTLIEFMKDKNIQTSKLVGMSVDGAATFSGKHNGMQSLLRRIHFMLCSYTAIATSFNLPVFKQLMPPLMR